MFKMFHCDLCSVLFPHFFKNINNAKRLSVQVALGLKCKPSHPFTSQFMDSKYFYDEKNIEKLKFYDLRLVNPYEPIPRMSLCNMNESRAIFEFYKENYRAWHFYGLVHHQLASNFIELDIFSFCFYGFSRCPWDNALESVCRSSRFSND